MHIICIRCGKKIPKDSIGEDGICLECKEERTKNGKVKRKKG